MIAPILHLATTLASTAVTTGEQQPELWRRWAALMLVLMLLGIIALTALAFLVARRRARRRGPQRPSTPDAPIADAWSESGKRFDGSIVEIRDDD